MQRRRQVPKIPIVGFGSKSRASAQRVVPLRSGKLLRRVKISSETRIALDSFDRLLAEGKPNECRKALASFVKGISKQEGPTVAFYLENLASNAMPLLHNAPLPQMKKVFAKALIEIYRNAAQLYESFGFPERAECLNVKITGLSSEYLLGL